MDTTAIGSMSYLYNRIEIIVDPRVVISLCSTSLKAACASDMRCMFILNSDQALSQSRCISHLLLFLQLERKNAQIVSGPGAHRSRSRSGWTTLSCLSQP